MVTLGCQCCGGFDAQALVVCVGKFNAWGYQGHAGKPYPPNRFYVGGDFVTFRGKTAKHIASFKPDSNGNTVLDGDFCSQAQFDRRISQIGYVRDNNNVTDYQPSMFVGDNQYTKYRTEDPAQIWKLNADSGFLSDYFAPIRGQFTSNYINWFSVDEQFYQNGVDANIRLVANNYGEVKVFDSYGQLVSSASRPTGGTNCHYHVILPGGGVLLTGRRDFLWPDTAGNILSSPAAVKHLYSDAIPGSAAPCLPQETDPNSTNVLWNDDPATNNASIGAGLGSNADCWFMLAGVEKAGSVVVHYVIISAALSYAGTDFKWNGQNATKQVGLYKIVAPFGRTSDYSIKVGHQYDGTSASGGLDFNFTCDFIGGIAFIQPLQIDSKQRIWFTGPMKHVNGTHTSPYMLYRVDSDGSNFTAFTGFDDRVYDCKSFAIGLDGKEQFIVVGAFTTYNGAPARRMVWLDEDGNIISNLNWA